jgi:prevent-host-death family protein
LAKKPSSGYQLAMTSHSVAEAKNQLSRLIDRALRGEPVVITRHGHPVVEIKPVVEMKPVVEIKAVKPVPRHTPAEALAWLDGKRLKLPSGVDVQAIPRQLRDGE